MLQNIIVFLLFSAAVSYLYNLVSKRFKSATKSASGCPSGCSCASTSKQSCANPSAR
ncbi:FeoB-associated Cys-rich membrane protein [Flexibacter flexilis]|uniref:FeoB-associated Cys-rich membrane protein n=1 Tax=Flexibacter flexilis TaxID=998 RepID=UPI0011604BB8|nr:FeoB-associated Cys-rich membrane protein [Flexibacter flexilis]